MLIKFEWLIHGRNIYSRLMILKIDGIVSEDKTPKISSPSRLKHLSVLVRLELHPFFALSFFFSTFCWAKFGVIPGISSRWKSVKYPTIKCMLLIICVCFILRLFVISQRLCALSKETSEMLSRFKRRTYRFSTMAKGKTSRKMENFSQFQTKKRRRNKMGDKKVNKMSMKTT